MKKLNFTKQIVILIMLFSITYVGYTQEIKPRWDQLPENITRDINGTNTYDGLSAGSIGIGGSYFGGYAGHNVSANTFGNTLMGYYSGYNITTGFGNTFLGSISGFNNVTGNGNVMLGFGAGANNTGNQNVFIGYYTGINEAGSNKLYIDNSPTTIPLIYGDFTTDKLGINTNQLPNNVGGADTSAYGLYVKGGILTEELRVRTGWADYVFEKDYPLLSLSNLEKYINDHGHLPNVPSSATVETQGIELGEITKIQQEKIEELTLYIIQLEKRLKVLEEQIVK